MEDTIDPHAKKMSSHELDEFVELNAKELADALRYCNCIRSPSSHELMSKLKELKGSKSSHELPKILVAGSHELDGSSSHELVSRIQGDASSHELDDDRPQPYRRPVPEKRGWFQCSRCEKRFDSLYRYKKHKC